MNHSSIKPAIPLDRHTVDETHSAGQVVEMSSITTADVRGSTDQSEHDTLGLSIPILVSLVAFIICFITAILSCIVYWVCERKKARTFQMMDRNTKDGFHRNYSGLLNDEEMVGVGDVIGESTENCNCVKTGNHKTMSLPAKRPCGHLYSNLSRAYGII